MFFSFMARKDRTRYKGNQRDSQTFTPREAFLCEDFLLGLSFCLISVCFSFLS